jgi:ribonuclease VapC
MSNSWILDASALLTLLNEEPGSGHVAEAIEQGAIMGAVNMSEVVSKLSELGVPGEAIHEILDNLGITIVDFDRSLAYNAGLLRLRTKKAGLSFGDRACLSVAERLQKPCLTADKAWAGLELPIEIKLIR